MRETLVAMRDRLAKEAELAEGSALAAVSRPLHTVRQDRLAELDAAELWATVVAALGDLARALVLGTPPDEAARPGTSDDGAADPQGAASEHSGMTRDARARLLALHS